MPGSHKSNTIQRPEDEKEDFYQCDKCEYKSKDTTNLRIHINRLHARASSVISKYSCNVCTYTNVNPNKMKMHKETKHSSLDTWIVYFVIIKYLGV